MKIKFQDYRDKVLGCWTGKNIAEFSALHLKDIASTTTSRFTHRIYQWDRRPMMTWICKLSGLLL